MKLLHFKIENCFCYRLAALTLDNRGLLLITGWNYDDSSENGSGKSSLVSKAICWWCWGATPEGGKTDDVVNNHIQPQGKKKKVCAKITGDFEGVDGEVYTLTRQRNPNKLELHLGKENLTLTSMAATQEKVNKLLGRTYETFLYADVFGQGRSKNFFALPSSDQKSIIENIVSYHEKLREASASCAVAIKEEEEVRIKLDTKLYSCEQKYNMLEAQKDKTNLNSMNWEQTQKDRLTALSFKIDEEVDRISKVLPLVQEAKQQQEQLAPLPDVSQLDVSIRNIKGWISNYQERLEKEKQVLKKTERDITIAELIVNKWVNGFNCPSCKQQLPSHEYTRLRQETDLKRSELTSLNSHKREIEYTIHTIKEYTRGCALSLEGVESTKRNFELLCARQAAAKSKVSTLEMEAQNRSTILIEEMERLNTEQNPFISDYNDLSNAVAIAKKKTDRLQKAVERSSSSLMKLNKWKKVFNKQLPWKLLEESVAYVEARTNEHLQNLQNPQLTTKLSLVETETGDIKLESTAHNKTGGDTYPSLSGGEKQMINFAAGLALADLAASQVNGSSNVMILDEPFENLSARNSESIVSYLETNERDKSIFLISHAPYLKGLIPKAIRVEKHYGISEVQGGSVV